MKNHPNFSNIYFFSKFLKYIYIFFDIFLQVFLKKKILYTNFYSLKGNLRQILKPNFVIISKNLHNFSK